MGKGEPTLPGAGISQGSNNARAQGSNEVYQQGQGLMPGAYTPNDYRQQQQYGGDYYDSQGAAYNYGQQQEGGFLQTGYQAGLRNQQQNFYLQQQQQQSPQQQLLQQNFYPQQQQQQNPQQQQQQQSFYPQQQQQHVYPRLPQQQQNAYPQHGAPPPLHTTTTFTTSGPAWTSGPGPVAEADEQVVLPRHVSFKGFSTLPLAQSTMHAAAQQQQQQQQQQEAPRQGGLGGQLQPAPAAAGRGAATKVLGVGAAGGAGSSWTDPLGQGPDPWGAQGERPWQGAWQGQAAPAMQTATPTNAGYSASSSPSPGSSTPVGRGARASGQGQGGFFSVVRDAMHFSKAGGVVQESGRSMPAPPAYAPTPAAPPAAWQPGAGSSVGSSRGSGGGWAPSRVPPGEQQQFPDAVGYSQQGYSQQGYSQQSVSSQGAYPQPGPQPVYYSQDGYSQQGYNQEAGAGWGLEGPVSRQGRPALPASQASGMNTALNRAFGVPEQSVGARQGQPASAPGSQPAMPVYGGPGPAQQFGSPDQQFGSPVQARPGPYLTPDADWPGPYPTPDTLLLDEPAFPVVASSEQPEYDEVYWDLDYVEHLAQLDEVGML